MIAPDLATLAVAVDSLTLLPGNPRRGDVGAVARSLAQFGQRKPIVARRDGTVIAGNHTLQAAQQLGWPEIAVVWVDDDDAMASAFALADNRTAELGGYDDQELADLIAEVQAADADLLAATGWSDADLVALLEEIAAAEPTVLPTVDPDDDPIAPPKDPVTKRGDVWLLGPHRLICGDCRDFGDVERLMDGNRANVVFTSPPYAEQRTYDESSGFRPIPPDEYVDWWEDLQANVRSVLADDGSFFVNIKPAARELDTELYVFDLVLAHVRRWGWHFATEFCWERGGMPQQVTRRFKNQFEPVYQFTVGDWKMRPETVSAPSDHVPIPLGPGGGDTSWNPKATLSNADAQGSPGYEWFRDRNGPGMAYPGNRLPTFAGSHEAVGHGAAFPVGLPEFFVKAYTDEGDHVLDPFMGSGSTLLAAHQTNRIAYGVELSPAYCDVICNRFQRHAGITPILESTSAQHDFMESTDGSTKPAKTARRPRKAAVGSTVVADS